MLFALALGSQLFAANDAHLRALEYDDLSLFQDFTVKTGIAVMNKELNGLNFTLTVESQYLAEECRNCILKFVRIKGDFSCLFRRSYNASFENVIFEGVKLSDALIIQSFSTLSFSNILVSNSSIYALVYESFNVVSMNDSSIATSSFRFYQRMVPLFYLSNVTVYNSSLLGCPYSVMSRVQFIGGQLDLGIDARNSPLLCEDMDLANTSVWVNFTFVVNKATDAKCSENKSGTEKESQTKCSTMQSGLGFTVNDKQPEPVVVDTTNLPHNASGICAQENALFYGASFDKVNTSTCLEDSKIKPGDNGSCYQSTCTKTAGVDRVVPNENNLTVTCKCKSGYEGERCDRCQAGYVSVGEECWRQVVAGGYCFLRGTTVECSSCDAGYKLAGAECRRLPDNGIYVISALFGAAGVAVIVVLIWLLLVCSRTRAPRYLAGVQQRPPQMRVGTMM